MPDLRPIGIFDSGVGGLTVFSAIASLLPHESLLYLGDTARVPYGTKSHDTVERYARGCARLLLDRDIKLLVVACNTASAYAVHTLQRELPIPVLGVIEPGARAAVKRSATRRIGVIGTAGTVASRAYNRAITALASDAQIISKPCPLFVPLVEEGWTHGAVPRAVASEYLTELIQQQIDTLVLGCTHYPLLAQTIQHAVGEAISLVDSAAETAEAVKGLLREEQLQAEAQPDLPHQFLVTDAPDLFAKVAKRFLLTELDHVEWVDVSG